MRRGFASLMKDGDTGISDIASGAQLSLDRPDATRIASNLRADGVAQDLAEALASMFVNVSQADTDDKADEASLPVRNLSTRDQD